MAFVDDLVSHLSRFPTAPFLFVGSGVSRRYLDLPTWEALLRHFAKELDKPYARYASDANGDLPTIASLIAEDFRDFWWTDARFAESRAAHPNVQTREMPLKIEVSNLVGSDALSALPATGELHDELNLLQQAVVEGVITTNYDPLLERIFPEFTVYAGQDELLFKDPLGIGEIYKIHGSWDKPQSLVLTGTDYERFRARNAYLAAKLLTMFVEHPVIFLGYSMADANVVEILASIASILTSANISELQDRLIFVQWDPASSTPVLAKTAIVAGGVTIPVVSATVASYTEVFSALTQLKRRFPARLLRRLKEQVYELVRTSESRGTLYVQDLNADASGTDVDVVIGVGVKARLDSIGVVGLQRADLLNDVLKDEPELGPATDIVHKALPLLLQHRANTPIYAYLRAAGLIADDGSVPTIEELPQPVRKRIKDGPTPFLPPVDYRKRGRELVKACGDLATLLERGDADEVLFFTPMVPADKIELPLLRQFLLEHRELFEKGHALQSTQWGKCVCLYDYLRFGGVAGSTGAE